MEVYAERAILHIEAALMKGEDAATTAVTRKNSAMPEADYLKILGERVREARARRGMTRRILAKDSDVSERYLAQLESGQGNVSILLLRQIAQALDVRLETLI